MVSIEDEGFWRCPDCAQENFASSRFCELCGKQRGSSERGPGPAMVARLRARADNPLPDDDDAPRRPGKRKVKVRMLDLSERVKGVLRGPGGARGRGDRRNPIPILFLAVVAWGFLRLIGYAPLMLLLRFIAFLLTPPGLVVWIAGAFVYSRYHDEIHRGIDTTRRRYQMFRRVIAQALSPFGWISRRMQSLLGARPPRDEEAETSRGARVRMLEEDWEDDDNRPEERPHERGS